MPAVAVKVKSGLDTPPRPVAEVKRMRKGNKPVDVPRDAMTKSTPVDDLLIVYPSDQQTRTAFRTRDGKKVTDNQWAVYDFTRTIPHGRVTTYGALCKALGKGSPRSVGSALRLNPFAPFVPCHRVIASNLHIGGYFGARCTTGEKCQKKIELLAMEGVQFTVGGYLANENLIWRG